MDRRQIVERLARERRVEDIARRVCGERADRHELEDLSQYVYEVLMTYSERCIVDLAEDDAQMNAFIATVCRRQYYLPRSRFWYAFRRFALRRRAGHDPEEEADAADG